MGKNEINPSDVVKDNDFGMNGKYGCGLLDLVRGIYDRVDIYRGYEETIKPKDLTDYKAKIIEYQSGFDKLAKKLYELRRDIEKSQKNKQKKHEYETNLKKIGKEFGFLDYLNIYKSMNSPDN